MTWRIKIGTKYKTLPGTCLLRLFRVDAFNVGSVSRTRDCNKICERGHLELRGHEDRLCFDGPPCYTVKVVSIAELER